MNKHPVRVFLDANVVIQAGKPPGGPLFARVVDLVRAGFIVVLTTDLTKTEVAKKHAKNDFDVIKEIGRSHFRKITQDVTGIELPALNKANIFEILIKKYMDETEKMFAALDCKTLSIDTIKPSSIFNDYTKEKAYPSASGPTK
jgi:hypothetical protein